MDDERLNKVEGAIVKLAETMSEYLAVESARKERDKHQIALNEKFMAFIDDYIGFDKPVVENARRFQSWLSYFTGKILLPAILVAVLLAAGAQIYDKASIKQAASKVK